VAFPVGDQAPLDARYGRRPADPARTRRRALLGVAAFVLVVAGFAWWVQATRVRLDYVVSGYEVTDDRSVDVSFSLTKDAGASAVCRVVAQNRYQEVVGTIDVTVAAGPGSERSQRTVRVPTRERAIVGSVLSCRLQ
jgi:hypothetical protein